MLTASCHCGRIHIEIDHAPAYLNECHCSICGRYGVRWAYYRPEQVRLLCEHGATQAYGWGERNIEFHHCRVCGCVTHWQDTDGGGDRMAINARLLEPGDLAEVPTRQSAGPRE